MKKLISGIMIFSLLLATNISCMEQSNPQSVESFIKSGKIFFDQKEYDQAIESYKSALNIDPDNTSVLISLGDAQYLKYLNNKEDSTLKDAVLKYYEKALKFLTPQNDVKILQNTINKTLRLDPKNITALIQSSNLQLIQKNFQAALDSYKKVLEVDENNITALIGMGDSYRMLKKFNDSLYFYKKVLDHDGSNITALNGIGDSYCLLDQCEKAIDYFKKTLSLDNNNVVALRGLGLSYQILEKYEQSIEYYKKVLKINPDNPLILRVLGYIQLLNNQPEDALKSYEAALKTLQLDSSEQQDTINRILKIDPNNIAALMQKGTALYERNNFKEALESYEAILKIDPDYAPALIEAGLSHQSLYNLTSAIQFYNKALENNSITDNQRIDILIALGNTYLFSKQYRQAINSYTKVIENQQSDIKSKSLALGHIITSLVNQGKEKEAIPYFEKILDIYPDSIPFLQNLSSILSKVGRYNDAIKQYKTILKYEENNIAALMGIGDTLYKLNKFEDAEEYYSKILSLNTPSASQTERNDAQKKINAISKIPYIKNYREGNELLKNKKNTEAIKKFNIAIKNNPKHIPSLLALAKLEQNDRNKLDYYNNILKLDPENSEAMIARNVINNAISIADSKTHEITEKKDVKKSKIAKEKVEKITTKQIFADEITQKTEAAQEAARKMEATQVVEFISKEKEPTQKIKIPHHNKKALQSNRDTTTPSTLPKTAQDELKDIDQKNYSNINLIETMLNPITYDRNYYTNKIINNTDFYHTYPLIIDYLVLKNGNIVQTTGKNEIRYWLRGVVTFPSDYTAQDSQLAGGTYLITFALVIINKKIIHREASIKVRRVNEGDITSECEEPLAIIQDDKNINIRIYHKNCSFMAKINPSIEQ